MSKSLLIRRIFLVLCLGLALAVPSVSALTCDTGGLNQNECRISSSHDITNEVIENESTDIIIESGGRLYTDHRTSSAPNDAKISLTDGSFIVKPGGAVHANINISAFNIKVADGGVIDSSGLGWQSATSNSGGCKFGSSADGLCFGGGPGGGVSGSGNSNTGAGGASHGGKGGSYKNDNYYGHGGGYGPENNKTYGSREKPATFGSGGGAQKDTVTLVNADGKEGHGDVSNYNGDLAEKILNATYGDGQKDDPDNDPLDADRWISTNAEYRKNNPNDIRMGSGGGRLKLTASNKINISGNILSNGLDGGGSFGSSGYHPGGGSGGSIWISAGGIFGRGDLKAEGGTYMEKIDRGQDAFGGGGGGGRIYYEFSIEDQEWSVNTSEGEGPVDLPDKGWGGNENSNKVKDEVATSGTIESQIAFSAFINETMVNPSDPIRINGTASSKVTVEINGSKVGETDPRASDGFYNLTVNSLNINKTENLGNYTMKVSSTISSNTITETFDISHRLINLNQSSDYILKPGESFRAEGKLEKYLEDGSNASKAVNYSNKNLTFEIFSGNTLTKSKTPKTNSTGNFNTTETIQTTTGRKYYSSSAENDRGITGSDRKNLSWMNINTSIVDPGQEIQINGSTHNPVTIYLEDTDGSHISKLTTSSPPDNGYFEKSFESLNIQDKSNLGNYTLTAETRLNDQKRNETWNISHREIEIFNDPDFLLKADENLNFSNYTYLIKEDGSGGSTRSEYSNQDLSFNFYNQSSVVNSSQVFTNSSGGYSVYQNIKSTRGLKRFTLEAENQNQVNDDISDEDIYNINNRSLAWVDINDSIVEPGQYIKINGSAHSTVYFSIEKPDGTYLNRNPVEPDSEGFYEVERKVLTRNQIQDFSDLGNYTFRVKTELNGKNRTEEFNISHREAEFYHSTDYLLRAGENFEIGGYANITFQDGSGGVKTEDYSNRNFQFELVNGSTKIRDTTESTDGSGDLSISDQMIPGRGRKYYVIEHENGNGINYLRDDNDLNNNARKNLSSVTIDDRFVNTGEKITVNGTAHNPVKVSFNGSEVDGSPVNVASDGFYELSFEVPSLTGVEDLGNQTVRVNTTVNGLERSERFNISIRGIRFSLNSSYPRQVDPEENFTVKGKAVKYVENGSGGSEAFNYTDEQIEFSYRDSKGLIRRKTDTTDSEGRFKISNLSSPANAGEREIELFTENPENLNRTRKETVETRIRLENVSTTSKVERKYRDYGLEQTRFVNPDQNVTFEADSRKSLDYVERVYANITLPDDSEKQLELQAREIFRESIENRSDWDEGDTSHLSHGEVQGDLNSGRLRLGYDGFSSEELLLELPMEENSGNVKDVSGNSNDFSPSGSVERGKSGVFSSNATKLSGGTLENSDQDALNLDSSYTFTGWINTDDSGAIYSRAKEFESEINPEIRISDSGTVLGEIASGGTKTQVESSTNVSDSKWHHFGLVYNTTHLAVYVDGNRESVSKVNAEVGKFQSAQIFGDSGTQFPRPLDASLDSIRFFNTSISPENISKMSSLSGSLETGVISTDEVVKDEFKLLNFEKSIKSGEIQVQGLSDWDDDSKFEETSELVNLSGGSDIYSLKGFENSSQKFKLNISITTDNASVSPLLSRIDLRARIEDTILWNRSRSVQEYLNGQYGTYKVVYGAEDFAGNKEDTKIEESNFTVRDIEIVKNHPDRINPGEILEIEGNVTKYEGDGSGDRTGTPFTGNLNVFFNDTIRGRGLINESFSLENVGSGTTARLEVNGSQDPSNAVVEFIGKFSGIDETLSWNSSQDWDGYKNREGTDHSLTEDSEKDNKTLRLGYPNQDLGGSDLLSYYSMDDESLPLNNSKGGEIFNAVNSPTTGSKGILDGESIGFNGSNGFEAGESPFSSTGSFTVNAWVNPEEIPSSGGSLGSGPGEPFTVFAVEDRLTLQVVDGGDVYAEINASGNTYSTETSSGNVKAGEWTMVTLVYNSQGDSLEVSTGTGLDVSGVTVSETVDLTGKSSFIGYRSDLGENGFKGKVDELRLYSRNALPGILRNYVGDNSSQQYLTTGNKTFTETVDPDSLRLDFEGDLNGQNARVEVFSEGGGSSDTINFQDRKNEYQITGNLAASDSFYLKVELDSNITNSPEIERLDLVRRFATEDPGLDVDSDDAEEANYSGRIPEGSRQTVEISNFTAGVKTLNFSVKNGEFDTRVNFTENLAPNNKASVQTNSSGSFSTTFNIPQVSGNKQVEYFTNDGNGIYGTNTSDIVIGMKFNTTTTEDLTNGDRIVDPDDSFRVNSTLFAHENPVDRIWMEVKAPDGSKTELDLRGSVEKWGRDANVSEVFSKEGNYSVSVKANDSTGIREIDPGKTWFNVTNGSVSIQKNRQVVGLERSFKVNGTVRQNLTSREVNASVNVSLPATGEKYELETDNNGFYNASFTAPSSEGVYKVKVSTLDENNITGYNDTEIEAGNSTDISLSVPSRVIEASGISLDEAQNKTFEVNVTNEGGTDIKNLTIYMHDLPTTDSDFVLEDFGATNWTSVNRTYDIPANTRKTVNAEVWISNATETNTFEDNNVSARFNTTGGSIVEETNEVDIRVTENRKPLLAKNLTLVKEEGFTGNLIPPDDSQNGSVKNEGTATATDAGWTVESGRVKSWIEEWTPSKDPNTRDGGLTDVPSDGDIPAGEDVPFYQIEADIPAGTPPGNYTTELETFSTDPSGTNKANLSVYIPSDSSYEISLEPVKDDITIPENINYSNPIQLGILETGVESQRLFNITLNNTGNRDLEWTLESRKGNGDTEDRFYFNKSNIGPSGTQLGVEDYKSDIRSNGSYTYIVPNNETDVLYRALLSAEGGIYRANMTVSCDYPIGGDNQCDSGQMVLPMNGTVVDPEPYFENVNVPEYTGVGETITVTGFAKDNSQVDDVNLTITRDVGGENDIKKINDVPLNLTSGFEVEFTPTNIYNEGTEDDQEMDNHSFVFEAVDDTGQKNQSTSQILHVKQSSQPDLRRDRTSVTLDNVTAESGDKAFLTGKVVPGKVKASNLNLSFSPSPSGAFSSIQQVEFGTLDSGTNKTFNVTLKSAKNLDPLLSYSVDIKAFWEDPDGKARDPDYEVDEETVAVNVESNTLLEVDHGASDTVTVPHNSSKREKFTLKARGNTDVTGINLDCVECGSQIFVENFNISDASLGPGDKIAASYNVTVSKFWNRDTNRDIKVSYDSGVDYLNDTLVIVPDDRSVRISSGNISTALPKNQSDVNISDLTTRNIGNMDLDLRYEINDTGSEIFVGDQKSDNSYSFSLSPGERDTAKIKSDTDEIELGDHLFDIKPKDDSADSLDSFNTAELSALVQDIDISLSDLNKRQEIIEGDELQFDVNLTQRGSPINSSETVDLKLEAGDNVLDFEESFSQSSKTWNGNLSAPDLEDGTNHTLSITATSSAFESSLGTDFEVNYKDVSPPSFVNLTAESARGINTSTISAELEDQSQIVDVSAKVDGPDSGVVTLNNVSEKKYEGEFNGTQKGLYTANVTASDELGNNGSEIAYFRVFDPVKVEGDAGDVLNGTTIKLKNPDGEVSEKLTPEGGTYNETIKSGEYDEAKIEISDNEEAVIENIEAKDLNQSPPSFNAEISEKLVEAEPEYLDGYAMESDSFKSVDANMLVNYSDFESDIDSFSNLKLMKCENYSIGDAEPCKSGYEDVPANNTAVDLDSEVVAANISGFSSYLLVEEGSSTGIQDLSGQLGNLSDLSNLDSLLEQVASNTEDLGGTSSGPGQTETTGQGGLDAGSQLDELASQLNQTGDQIAVGNKEISVELEPGEKKSTAVSLQNPKNEPVELEVDETDNLEPLLNFTETITLSSGEFRTLRIDIDASNYSRLREISGFIRLTGNGTERTIPTNVKIVSSENRLLDVTLEPTVESFNPGEEARLKLSFSNQGFSRAVDAETTVSIVDITRNKTMAKTTSTYAVQTTLDRIVTMQIPEDAQLGVYEAKAEVSYSNIPGNRSATAVDQVEVKRSFLERRTLGVKNMHILIGIIILIIAGSVGGYWYYRKKKLEEKRKRFEEQVDNDAIPSESGRTAFIGKLSEIGTRSFVNLDDLMTHCLTAGATGAGKTVAAQVIVEEALEQGVNVIVLDPTGQWSGYLDENEDDDFFAFYDDFGMKESDARNYKGNIRAVDADQDTIDITDVMRPEEDEGSIHVFSMHKLENAELEEYLSDTIQQIFDYNPEEKDHLETLIVYDEAHRVLEKFGGTGRGVKMLERGAREFRKWGVGMLMISQVIEDFPEEVRANIGTQIQMRTEYEGDLDRIERKYGNNITQGVTKADTGTGMLQNSSYNHGRPYFIDFRPVKHSPERLSDEDLDKFEKYNRRVDEIEDMISVLEDQGEDVFEYESQLKLVKKNIRKRSFNLVDTYLDELEEDLNDALDL